MRLSELEVRVDEPPCSPGLRMGAQSVQVQTVPTRCTPSTTAFTLTLPTLARAELIGVGQPEKLTMQVSFFDLPVLEKWIPAVRAAKLRGADHAAISKLAFEQKVFSYFDPFVLALGMSARSVSVEKILVPKGKELLDDHPTLANTGMTATESIPMPSMAWLSLAR